MPAVAAEVLELTRNPTVDAAALRACIERDPALALKVLRVVNSPLFGVSRQVSDLQQAVALLGVKPLKLLVLGFNLPEGLLLETNAGTLAWYWRTTLARAVAAREVAALALDGVSDDAFLAGLLQDIGVLALLRGLGSPYAAFLHEVIETGADLHRLEVASLGFDHTELTADLLRKWKLPLPLIEGIAHPRIISRLAEHDDHAGRIAQALHVGDLAAQIAAARRWAALPELMEAGNAYFGMGQAQMLELMESLQPKVAQLADAMSVESTVALDCAEIVARAHEQLAAVAEDVVVDQGRELGEALREAALRFAQPPMRRSQDRAATESLPLQVRTKPKASPGGPSATAKREETPSSTHYSSTDETLQRLVVMAGICRAHRQSISVVLLVVEPAQELSDPQRRLLERVCAAAADPGQDAPHAETLDASPRRRLIALPDCDRQEAVHLASGWVERLRGCVSQLAAQRRLPPCQVGAGVATAVLISRNFAAETLLETAQRCTGAALSGLLGGVKSLEVS